MSWLIPRSRLTPEQIRAVELGASEHRLVLGGPGSGKTQVLLHRADFLRLKYSTPAERFRIFVFTKTLKEYIASALGDLDIPESSVSTLASWVMDFHARNIGAVPWDQTSSKPDWSQLYRGVAEYAERTRPSLFDFVLVDEGQDLDEYAFRILTSVSKHVTVCMDRKQKIYDGGADEHAVLKQLGLRKRNLSLLDALRCSPYIISVASALVEDPEEGRELLAQTRTLSIERETPVVYFARDHNDELAKLVDMVKTRQIAGDRVGIFFPQKRQVKGFAQGLSDAGLIVESQDELNFSSNSPKLLTYYSAKGLTFDSVLMPRLVDKSFPYRSRSQIERLLFVGVSRAVRWAYFSTYENTQFSPLDKVTALETRGQITVLKASRKEDHEPPAGEDLLDFL